MKKEMEEAMVGTVGITTLAPKGPKSNVVPKGVIELSDDESEGLIASFAATASTGPSNVDPSAPRGTAVPDTSGDWEFARWLSADLNREEILGDGELAYKLFVELN